MTGSLVDVYEEYGDPNVVHPQHYNQGKIECIEKIYDMGYGEGFTLGSAVKYIERWKSKGGIEDLKKARFYLDYHIKHLEEQSNDSSNRELSEDVLQSDG